jgi:hypothetical protein
VPRARLIEKLPSGEKAGVAVHGRLLRNIVSIAPIIFGKILQPTSVLKNVDEKVLITALKMFLWSARRVNFTI